MTPGKQSKWASKLSLKDKDIFHDPSVSFKPLPPPFKPRTVQRLQPSIHISARSTKSTSKDCIEDCGYYRPSKNQRDVHAIKHVSFSINENSTQREKDLSDDDEKKPKARTAIVPTHVTEKNIVPIDAIVEVVKPPPASVTSEYNHFNWIMTHCEIPKFGLNSIPDS